jgi:GR25 family glycosyltransferase involved in LPS biosynthesis
VTHIGVVGDARRGDMAQNLFDHINADILTLDRGDLGCTGNHALMWRELAKSPADWNVVLEDDAIPVAGFRDQLDAALATAPAPIVSLYLGTGYIDDSSTSAILNRADHLGANWLVTPGRVLHAVALAVRGDLVPSLVQHALPAAGRPASKPIDRAIANWARARGHRVAYSVPSLVDHADEKSLVIRYRRTPRKAWRVGTRDAWCDKMMHMV